MSTSLATALQEWKVQEKELQQLQVGFYLSQKIQNQRPFKTNISVEINHFCVQDTHRLYLQKLEEVSKLQKSFAASIERQKKNLNENLKSLSK